METIALTDAAGNVVVWHYSAAQLLGWTAEEAIGKPFVELVVAPIDRTVAESALAAIRKDFETVMHLPLLLSHNLGHTLAADCTLFMLHNSGRICVCAALESTKQPQSGIKNREHPDTSSAPQTAIIICNTQGMISFWNPEAERMFGYGSKDMCGRLIGDFFTFGLTLQSAEFQHALFVSNHWEGDCGELGDKNELLPLTIRCDLERDENAMPSRILISITDKRVWLKDEKGLVNLTQKELQDFDSLFKHHPDGVFAFNLESQSISVNSALTKLTGYTQQELQSYSLKALVTQSSHEDLTAAFSDALRGKPQTNECICIKKDSSLLEISITMLPNIVDHRIIGVHGIVKDISRHKRDERRILYLANHDALTGLPNRNLLQDRMQHAIDQSARLNLKIGVMFLDLDRFKVINDSLGHIKGDMLLCVIADRLKGILRNEDTVARVGGDEFVIILENMRNADQVAQLSKEILRVICQPIVLDGHILNVSTSIGASMYPQDGEDAVSLLKNADQAMYAAKKSASGSGGFWFYRPDMNAKALARLTHETDLRHAIEHHELVLHYQPRLDIARNAIVGVEALVRWDHPEKGLIFPNNFIGLAEETGMIDALGEWVLQTACRQMSSWRSNGLSPMKMAVNVSAIQLKSTNIHRTVSHALEEADLDSDYLELEITESTLMQDINNSYDILKKFRKMGISLSIDDFGIGYSSLSYLKHLPIDTLKIDKSFISQIPENDDDAAIVKATIAMAQSMHLGVIAEGVTSIDQLNFLENLRCDQMQGYLFCQPLPASEIETFFKTSEIRGIEPSWRY